MILCTQVKHKQKTGFCVSLCVVIALFHGGLLDFFIPDYKRPSPWLIYHVFKVIVHFTAQYRHI